jgi:hypothetical protein
VEGFLLQDWTSIRVSGASATVTQSEIGWLDLDGYRDLVMWLEVRNVAVGGGTSVVLDFETSPVPDDNFFATMASETLAASGSPVITKILATAATPLDVWVRWKLRATGSPASEWGATFRIHCSANPTKVPP